MKKWAFWKSPGNLIMVFSVGMVMLAGLWYLISNHYIIIKW